MLNYDPSSDTIEIVHYNKKKAQNDPMNVYTYRFLLFSKATGVSRLHCVFWIVLFVLLVDVFRACDLFVGILAVSANIQEVCRPLQMEQG